MAKQNEGGKVSTGIRRFESKVFKPAWTKGGRRFELEHYAIRLRHDGKRATVNLQTADAREAARRAARFATILAASGWEAAHADLSPEQARVVAKRDTPTVGDLIREADRVAVHVKAPTLRGYGNCLRQLATLVAGIEGDASRFNYRTGGTERWRETVDAIRIGTLTPRAVEGATAAYVKSRGTTDSAKRTMAAVLRGARAFWSRRLRRLLPFENLPDPFEGVVIESPRPPRYVSTVNATALVEAARSELRDGGDPEAWKALLLELGAGLRRGEVDQLLWANVDASRRAIRVIAGKSWESVAEVPLADGIASELERLRPDAKGLYVLEGGPRPGPDEKRRRYGAHRTWRRLTDWLRRNGVNSRTPNHSMRKECGAIINATAGLHAASRFLRHADVAVTASHYSDARNRVVVPLFDDSTPGKTGGNAS
ncbi:MAG: site-specific integrase [Verrucomicrobiae bacterium]|nr:site-specific integrase [Verrucomicrobiae bacterium]